MTERRILDAALLGRTLDDEFVVDCHGHIDHWKLMSGIDCDVDSMIADMDRVGIDVLCINKWNCPDIFQSNTDVANALKKYPGRFVAYATTQPCLGKQATLDELKRCFDELGFSGIKIHNAYETLPMRDMWYLPEFQEAMDVIWSFAADRRCSLLCHWLVPEEVLKRYPEAQFIIAHSLGIPHYANTYAPYPNAYFDTAASTNLRGNLEHFVALVGAERILYGSDMPYANPAYRLGQVVGTRVPDADIRKIIGGNMARLLNLEIPGKYR